MFNKSAYTHALLDRLFKNPAWVYFARRFILCIWWWLWPFNNGRNCM